MANARLLRAEAERGNLKLEFRAGKDVIDLIIDTLCPR